ncbi:MAG TPA: EVE domain-containing protein [Aestuariivirgaceae bacterium]
MAYWLLKTEPETWSWDQQRARGKAGEEWTGVRNYQARSNLRAMKKGDLGFFYHTGSAKEIVGVVEVSAPAHSDSTDKTGEWISVDLKAVRSLKTPVSMAAIKAEPRLKNMVLVRNSRLSVQPVAPEEWRLICKMGGIEP